MNKFAERFQFYLKHSFNDLRVNKSRTVFALMCIVIGVGTLVGLQTFGVIIINTLSGNLQESNHGDIRLNPYDFEDEGGFEGDQARGEREGILAEDFGFSLEGVDKIRDYLADRYGDEVGDVNANVTYVMSSNNVGLGSVELPKKDNFVTVSQSYFVEKDKYPLYGDIQDEEGNLLKDMLHDPTDVVISRNLADTLEAKVGDQIKISGSSQLFTVRGIMDTREEGGFDNLLGSLFGYWFADVSALPLFESVDADGNYPALEDTHAVVTTLYIRLDDPTTESVERVRRGLGMRYPYLGTRTTEDLRQDNEDLSVFVDQSVSLIGLVSLLLAGIGIINTMLVVVRRRTLEIAVLKTLGLQPGEISNLFFVESAMMGFFGSLIGIPVGWLIALFFKIVGGAFFNTHLYFEFALGPAFFGIIVGVVVTTIFGLLPTLTAGQVRPATVLRPNDNVIARAGLALSFVAMLVVIMALSLVAQTFLNDLLDVEGLVPYSGAVGGVLGFLIGVAMLAGGLWRSWTGRNVILRVLRWPVVFFGVPVLGVLFGTQVQALLILVITMLAVGVLYMVLWVLIWLVGHFFPTFRIVDLKVALRAMLAAKSRSASALLALVIGIFTLSVMVMLVTTIRNFFEDTLIDITGGNVLVFAAVQGDVEQQIEQRMSELTYLDSYTQVNSYETRFVSYEDVSSGKKYTALSQFRPRIRSEAPSGFGDDYYNDFEGFFDQVDGRDLESNLPDVDFEVGRQLTPTDAGQPVIVLERTLAIDAAGFDVGDKITLSFSNGDSGGEEQQTTFTIVGLSESSEGISINNSRIYVPRASVPEAASPTGIQFVVDMPDDKVNQLRRDLSEIPGAFVLETRLLSDLINRLLDTFTFMPTLLAGVALVTGGIVVANAIALSTMERRREIAIMKAVGLQRRRVLGMLLMENSIMGLLAGLIGVGISVAILLLLLITVFERELGTGIPIVSAFILMMACVVISLLAALLSVWGASSEKPLKVLRYE